MKTFSYFFATCCCVEVFGCIQTDSPPAMISIDHFDDFRIIDLTNNSECSRFRVSVFSNPKKCADGSIQFALRLHLFNFNETIRFEEKTIESSENGKVFFITIPKNELSNEIFFKDIQIKSDNRNYKFDVIKLKIEPKVEIFADQKQVNFGRISHNGVRMISDHSPSVTIRYSVLKDAICEIVSKNNFRLKNKDNYIPYSVNGLTENGEIQMPSDQNKYIANFKIVNDGKKPIAGIYSDKITFSIKTDI